LRAQATIRAGGFSPAQVFAAFARWLRQLSFASEMRKTCARQARLLYGQKTIRTANAVTFNSPIA